MYDEMRYLAGGRENVNKFNVILWVIFTALNTGPVTEGSLCFHDLSKNAGYY